MGLVRYNMRMACRRLIDALAVVISLGSVGVAAAAEPLIHKLLRSGEIEEANERLDERIARDRQPNQDNGSGLTTAHVAAGVGAVDAVAALLAYGIPVDLRDDAGRTPLVLAAGAGQTAVVTVLLAAGADVNLSDAQGITPLMAAAAAGRPAAVSALLAAGADVVARDRHGADALIHAVNSRRSGASVYEQLFSAGVVVDNVGAYGLTALYLARANGDAYVVDELLERGVDPAAADLAFERGQLRHEGYFFGAQFERANGRCQDPRFAVTNFLLLRDRVLYQIGRAHV